MTHQLTSLRLEQKYTYLESRVRSALYISAIATLGVTVAIVIFFALNLFQRVGVPQSYHLFSEFVGWDGKNQIFGICEPGCEVTQHIFGLFSAAQDVPKSVTSMPDKLGNIAGIARLGTLVAVAISVFFAYRKMLDQHYGLYEQPAQQETFSQMSPPARWIARILYTGASIFGAYVMVSIMWLGLSMVFKGMTLDIIQATIVVTFFTGLVTFVVVFGALAVTTSDILLLALATYAIGFLVSFALTEPTCKAATVPCVTQQWWEVAVSNAGRANPSALLFTGTLLSGSLALIVVWFDIDSTLKKMIREGDVRRLTEKGWIIVIRLLFALFILGLLFVGFVRVDQNKPPDFPQNQWFHTGGAVGAVAIVILFAYLIRKEKFHPWYTYFSIGMVVVTAVMGVLMALGIVNLTVVELTIFLMIGLWVYVTVTNMLTLGNIATYTNRDLDDKDKVKIFVKS